MKTNNLAIGWVAICALGLAPAMRAHACGSPANLPALAAQAISENRDEAQRALEKLRQIGPAGLDALLSAHAEKLKLFGQSSAIAASNADEWERVRAALDAVGQQRDCHASRLYWFTDLEQAKAAARASGKPILSLRLLGRLNEEYSCANSRFFRTTLYANRNVAQFLRGNFVLHWKSVRPVPRITIDFGDGRKIERTITGNSIHYVLDAEGGVIDALPGLYSPQAFMKGLALAGYAAGKSAALAGTQREEFLRRYHSDRIAAIETQWADDLDSIGGHEPPPRKPLPISSVSALPPSAVMASGVTLTKAGIERPYLCALTTRPDAIRAKLESGTDDAMWTKIAALPANATSLDRYSRELIRAKNPDVFAAGRVALSKRIVEDPMLGLLRKLERSIAEDTVRNEYLLHAKIHEWFATGNAPAKLDALNSKVYAELFLTPDSDPWLGLAPADVFAALDNAGLVQSPTKH